MVFLYYTVLHNYAIQVSTQRTTGTGKKAEQHKRDEIKLKGMHKIYLAHLISIFNRYNLYFTKLFSVSHMLLSVCGEIKGHLESCVLNIVQHHMSKHIK